MYIGENPTAGTLTQNSKSATPGANTVSGSWSYDYIQAGGYGYVSSWFCVSVLAGSVDVAFTRDTLFQDCDGVTARLYDCNGALVDTVSFGGAGSCNDSFSDSGTLTAPSDGIYYVQLEVNIASVGSTNTTDFTCTVSATALVTNPVIALWDDSGTTRQLEACPKLYLPLLTESTGDWYADCAEADGVLADPLQVSNCVGWCGGGPGLSAFTATDGGTSLTLATTNTTGCSTFGSVNCETGETITLTGSVSAGTMTVLLRVYDYTGALLYDSGTVSSPATSSALPYTGRYIVNAVVASDAGGGTNASGVITSSGTLTVNEIQALYDVGLDCAARLNCGDSCP